MEYYAVEVYFSFTCLAGACPSTCCAGWSIQVDGQDYSRFSRLPQEKLREDIISHIEKRNGRYFFQNRADGSCAMLDGDGLCRIQRNTSEETLCNTCRKYPRLFDERQDIYYFSMAASCPVISGILWRGELSYVHRDASGRIQQVEGRRIPVALPVWEYYSEMEQKVSLYRGQIDRVEFFWDFAGALSGLLTDMLPGLPAGEREAWQELVLFYQGKLEKDKALSDFFAYKKQQWHDFTGGYLSYRFMSRQAICRETPEETYCHSLGEVFLVQAACFPDYVRWGAFEEASVCAWIQRVYRLCAHGKKQTEQMHRIFCEFFREKSLWLSLIKSA